jgi:hypothetical protein
VRCCIQRSTAAEQPPLGCLQVHAGADGARNVVVDSFTNEVMAEGEAVTGIDENFRANRRVEPANGAGRRQVGDGGQVGD